MKTKHLSKWFVALLGTYLLVPAAFGANAEKPNILLILTDDQAYDAVHALGWEKLQTPNLDRLAEQGVTFTHAYNQGSWDGAVCVASRTMLVTGKSLWHAHRDVRNLEERYVKPAQSWPQLIRAAGYHTYMTGKWHVAANPKAVFDEVRHLRPGMPQGVANAYNRPRAGQEDKYDPADETAGGYWQGGRHWSEVVADDAIDLMNMPRDDGRPFFLYAAFNAPHDPRQAPAQYVAMYPPAEMSVPESIQGRYPFAEAMGAGPNLRDEKLAPFPRTPEAIRVHRSEYAALITHLDAQIGRILAELERLGLRETTRIVFTSDHGLAIGRHGLLGKQNMYDHSMRVPLVLAGPGLPQGKRISTRVYMQDIHPTVLSWAGATNAEADFRDLSPLLENSESDRPDLIYGAYLDKQRMVTSGDWKLIVYPEVPVVRLYNLAQDPKELVDLADRKEHRELVARLLNQLHELQAAMGDPLDLDSAQVDAHSLVSPDGRIKLTTKLASSAETTSLEYSVAFDGKPVLQGAKVSFVTTDGKHLGHALREIGEPTVTSHDSTWKPVFGERSEIRDHYKQLELNFVDDATGHEWQVEFRCYDAGIAYRVDITASDAKSAFQIEEEQSEFQFLEDHPAWCARWSQDTYEVRPISKIEGRVERPLVLKLDDDLYAAITEAGLVDYSTMQLRSSKDNPHCIVSDLGGSVQAEQELQTPWRVVMLGTSPGELLENNDIVLNLSEPCAIADTSWIKPGKVIREITLTTAGGKACVDFASEMNFQYVEFDAGWYGNESDDSSDATTVTVDDRRNIGDLDLHEVIDYANQRGIGIIMYVNRRALETQLDEILPLYQKWGIAGIKYGFVNTETQKWTSWLHEAVRKAADHKLMVDIHDNYRPVGYSRTYPNLMTQEGVHGDEATPSSAMAVTTLFTRNLAGAADHTICYFAPRVREEWTAGHQLAKAVCTYSPWQFLYWYDTPMAPGDVQRPQSHIVDTPEQEFFAKVPTVWDETRVLQGEIGEYAVIARRSGHDWFVGALNNQCARTVSLPLTFLEPEVAYSARLYSDDEQIETVTQVRVVEQPVDSSTSLRLELVPNGGQSIWVTPSAHQKVATQPEYGQTRTASKEKVERAD